MTRKLSEIGQNERIGSQFLRNFAEIMVFNLQKAWHHGCLAYVNAVAAGNQENKYVIIYNPSAVLFHRSTEQKVNKMKAIKNIRKSGFTLVEIMIVVAIIGLLAAIAIPNFVKARQTSQTNACINNLRVIDAAKQQWALENGKPTSSTPASTDIVPYLGRSGTVMPLCPLSQTSKTPYVIGNLTTVPTCPNYATNTHAAVLSQ
jgi:prepilin-type N-terminal cleavage/methylation domain-containing protein